MLQNSAPKLASVLRAVNSLAWKTMLQYLMFQLVMCLDMFDFSLCEIAEQAHQKRQKVNR